MKNELPKTKIDERTGIEYRLEGDYYIPDLYLAENEYEKNYHIGKYGHLRLEYLKKYKKADYTIMLMEGS